MTVQVCPTMGMDLAALVPVVESNFAQQLPDFENVGTTKGDLAGRDAYRMEFRYRKDGEMIQSILLVTELDETRMFSVSISASPDDLDTFRPAFDRIGKSVDLDGVGG